MGRSLFDQETQVHSSGTYDDTVAPTEAAYETNPTELETDLNNIRSYLHELRDVQNSNWWAALIAPTTFTDDSPAARGVQDVGDDLWDVQRKRVLRRRVVLGSGAGPVSASAQHIILDAAGELPGNTTAAIGAVTTLGTVVAYAATFDSAQLTEVAGDNNLQPKNLCKIVDTASGDPVLDDSGREVYGLLQSESNTDGATIATTTPNRVQISFVVRNATNDDLELVTAGDVDGITFDYAPIERYAFESLSEAAFLGPDYIDIGAGSADREGAYSNQGTDPVDVTTNSILDLESAGIYWKIRDDAEADLFTITEGSSGSTTDITIGSDVDTYVNDALDIDFDQGISVNTGGTRPIDVGSTDGVIESTAGDLEIQAASELNLDDGNKPAGWSRAAGILLSDTADEWTDFETEFGEVSLLNAILQAKQDTERAMEWGNVNADVAANTNVTGAGGSPNITAQMPSYSGLTFVDDVDVYVNGQKQRPGADAAANNDVYPGDTAANGDLKFEYALKYRGGTNPDNINVVVWGQTS
jgi:hypothetical protein